MPNAQTKKIEWVIVVVPKDESYQIYSETQARTQTVASKALSAVMRVIRAYVAHQVFPS